MKREAPHILTCLDLELNQNKETGARIIQVGACVGDLKTGEILEKLSVYVNPLQELEPFIIQLTKIKQQDVDNGTTLEEAYAQLEILHKKYNSFVNCVVWGCGDVRALHSELLAHNPEFKSRIFGRREIDTKTIYCAWRLAQGLPPSGGLSTAARNLKVKWRGQAHDALDDSINTWNVFCNLVDKYKI